jgi:transforming growth factor-beta-induced protein
MFRIDRFRLAQVAAVATLAALTGCGDDTSKSTTTTTTTDTASSQDSSSGGADTAGGTADTSGGTTDTASASDTAANADAATGPKDIVDTAVANGSFKTLAKLLGDAGLVDTLKGAGPFTVFAPTDEAFAKVDPKVLEALGKDKEKLGAVLKHHVLSGKVASKDAKTMFATTVAGFSLPIKVDGGKVSAGGAMVTTADVEASNGVIHVVDKVILPPTLVDLAMASADHKTLVDLVVKAKLADVVANTGPYTVFAPTDAAFAAVPKALLDAVGSDEKLLQAVLTHHVLSGAVKAADVKTMLATSLAGFVLPVVAKDGSVTVGGAKVVATDLVATNGVIHVVDTVILPPDVVDIAMASADHTTLVDLVKLAGLVETLQGDGPFTIFAPTNAAFAKVDPKAVEALKADKAALAGVLTYHVVAGMVKAKDVAAGEVATVNGAKITIAKDDKGVTVNGAKVIATDLVGTNGVIHVIDGVLLPPAK